MTRRSPVRKRRGALVLAFVAALVAGQVGAAEPVKIGFITSLSGPAGVIGKHMKDSVELGLDHLGRKVGGLDVEMIYGDDRSEEHTSELQSRLHLVCRLLLEKKKKKTQHT